MGVCPVFDACFVSYSARRINQELGATEDHVRGRRQLHRHVNDGNGRNDSGGKPCSSYAGITYDTATAVTLPFRQTYFLYTRIILIFGSLY